MYFIKTYRNNSKIDYGVKHNGGWTFSVLFLSVVFVILVAFYIVEANLMTVKNYEIKAHDKELEGLRIDNQRLVLEKTRMSSFDFIKSKISLMELSELKVAGYLDIFDPAVAVNR